MYLGTIIDPPGTAIVIRSCSYLHLELFSGSSRYQRLVSCILGLGYFLLLLNLLYSKLNSVLSKSAGCPGGPGRATQAGSGLLPGYPSPD